MATTDYTFTYFDLRGIGEMVRIMHAYAGKQLNEVRIPYNENWFSTVKPGVKPLQQIPIIEMDGEVFPQSVAIWNFFAREFGLYPNATKDQLLVDVVIGVIGDMIKEQAKWFYLKDGPEKEKLKDECPDRVAKFLSYLDSLVAKNKTGYFVGSPLSLADVAVFDMISGFLQMSLGFSKEAYPNLAQSMDNVLKNENIAAYVASRPHFDL